MSALDPMAAGAARAEPAGGQAVEEVVVRRCGHHGNPLVYIEARNPESGCSDGAPWGWRCIHCFPEAFPGFRRPEQRLREVQAVVALMEDELSNRLAYSGDPDPGGTAALRKWCAELRDCIATHRAPAARLRTGDDG